MEMNDKFINIYTMLSCMLNKDINDAVDELIEEKYDNYILNSMENRLKEDTSGKSDIELSIECFKGIGGVDKIDPSYRDEMFEIMDNYSKTAKKKLLLKKVFE